MPLAIDVAAFEPDPLLGPQTGQAGDGGKSGERRRELHADRLELVQRLEGEDLAALRLRVPDGRGRVPGEELDAGGLVEAGAQRLRDAPG